MSLTSKLIEAAVSSNDNTTSLSRKGLLKFEEGKTQFFKCPRCGQEYSSYPAVSRFDNETLICPDCGTDEAIINFRGGKLEDPHKFDITQEEPEEVVEEEIEQPASEDLEVDDKNIKDSNKKELEDRIGELRQALQDDVSDDERPEIEKEIDELEAKLNECDKLEESSDIENELKSLVADLPDEVEYKGKTYKAFNYMDSDNRSNVSKVYYCNMENTPNNDPQESDDYFLVDAELSKSENGYKGVKSINRVEDFTESLDESNSYTREELKQKYGTDDINIINAGKEESERVSLKEGSERHYTDKLLDAIEEGMLDKDEVLLACIKWMSEDDVRDMCIQNDFFDMEYDEEAKLEEETETTINEDTVLKSLADCTPIYTDFSNFPKVVEFGRTPEERKNLLILCYYAKPTKDDFEKLSIEEVVSYIKETDERYEEHKEYVDECVRLVKELHEEAEIEDEDDEEIDIVSYMYNNFPDMSFYKEGKLTRGNNVYYFDKAKEDINTVKENLKKKFGDKISFGVGTSEYAPEMRQFVVIENI